MRRIRDRIRARFDVSIAEVEDQDLHQRAVFGVGVVSGDATVCESVLEQVAREAELSRDAVLTARATEIITVGEDLYSTTEDDDE